jgi:hypothetical protein
MDVEGAIEVELDHPLEMGSPPQMRATLIEVATGEQVLVIVMSHVTMDGWSIGLFLHEFSFLLDASADAEAHLADVDFQYYDFAGWQHQEYRAGRFAAEEQYWREQWAQLDGADIRHREIPFAVSAGPDKAGSVSFLRRSLGPEESAVVRTLVPRLRVTPYVFFRTVMTVVLHHYTKKQRLAFWANFANREFREFHNMMGWCSNTHVVTVTIAADSTCVSLCRDVADAISAARAHEGLPLPALWQRLGQRLDRHETRVNFDLLPRSPRRVEGHPFELDLRPMRGMDLDVRIQGSGDDYRFTVTHSPRYSPEGVAAMLASLLRVSVALAATPEMRVADCAPLIEF